MENFPNSKLYELKTRKLSDFETFRIQNIPNYKLFEFESIILRNCPNKLKQKVDDVAFFCLLDFVQSFSLSRLDDCLTFMFNYLYVYTFY